MSEWGPFDGSMAEFGNSVKPLEHVPFPIEKVQLTQNLMDILEPEPGKINPHALRAPIAEEEVALVDRMLAGESENWELVRDFGRTLIERYHDRNAFGGIYFGRFKHVIPSEVCAAPLELVTDLILNFNERARWDVTAGSGRGFRLPNGSELLNFEIHAPPFGDRDSINFHAVARRKDGNGVMTYMRQADDAFLPARDKFVRARMVMCATEIVRTDRGIEICITNAVDVCLPVLPYWLISFFIPGEMKKWFGNLEKQVTAKVQQGWTAPRTLALPTATELAAEPSGADGGADEAKRGRARAPTLSTADTTPSAAGATPLGSAADATPSRLVAAGLAEFDLPRDDLETQALLSNSEEHHSAVRCGACFCF